MKLFKIRNLKIPFWKWQIRNSFKSFKDYYVAQAFEKISKGASHPTLGKKLKDKRNKGGKENFEILVNLGLKPNDTCLDYGCGSLRIGQYLINYLNEGNYYGLDITDKFYLIGKEMLSPEQLKFKKPHFFKINKEIIRSLANKDINVIFSFGVLLHVPPRKLKDYFHNLLSLLSTNSKLYIGISTYRENKQTSPVSWVYTQTYLKKKLIKQNSQINVNFEILKNYSKPTQVGILELQSCILTITK